MWRFFEACLDLVLPSFCLGCDRPLGRAVRPLFCPDCRSALKIIRSPLCPCCGRTYLAATGSDHYCGPCLAGQRHFDRARAMFLYEEPIKKLIHRFKYQGKTDCLVSVSTLARDHPALEEMREADLIIPVPLHPARLRERGFNQALLLARAIFPGDRRVVPRLLIRIRATAPQAGFDGAARRANLRKAFEVTAPGLLAGKRILLIDDVLTTGSTVNECAKTLKKAGAAEVLVITLARVREDY